MPKWKVPVKGWIAHSRKLSNWWWAVIAGVWSAFSVADTIINHWGSDSLKADWKAATLHFPFGWQTWTIGILVSILILVYHESYRHSCTLEREKARLLWSDDRPLLLFDSWGEVPHDHPEARFHEIDTYRKEREYFERGFFLTNHGGTAHEVKLMPIQFDENIYALSGLAPRIDKDTKGFVFAWMDTEHNAKFGEDSERWDLAKVMGAIEMKLNSTRIEEHPLTVEVAACYRDPRGVWFVSTANMAYRKDLNRIIFSTTEQIQHAFTDRDVIQKLLTRS
jgi:hypothetical protein